MTESPWTFLALPEELTQPARAEAWVLPVPYEATTCYGKGTRNGPDAIMTASRLVELFDHEFGCEPASQFGVHVLPPLDPADTPPAAMVARVAEAVAGILTGSPAPRLLAVLGGEHSLSAGVARGIAQAFPGTDLVAVQIDAHADLRDEYGGSPHSHACAARRILETCPVFQIGVRSLSAGEDEFRRGSSRVQTVFAEEMKPGGAWRADLARFARGRTVFLTIDVDGLDPSIMPAVGTPEPGGISWETTIDVARIVCREAARLPVFDVVELAPIPGMLSPEFTCARLVYKIMSLALFSGRKPGNERGARQRRAPRKQGVKKT